MYNLFKLDLKNFVKKTRHFSIYYKNTNHFVNKLDKTKVFILSY